MQEVKSVHDKISIRISAVTYRISRQYTGNCPISALLEQQIMRAGLEKPSVDAISPTAL